MEKNLGHATAYGYAKSKGYSGTEDEFAELMADYASVGQSAAQSAEQAAASATSASGSAAAASQAAQTATDKASEAVTAADTATTKASEASQSASTASAAATSASTSAQTATAKAGTATAKADAAATSEAAALSAKTDAESARDAAAQSASEAAESARTLTIDDTLTQTGQAADAKTVGDAIANEDKKALAAFATDTASGSIASFADGADSIPMKDVLVHIEPVQEGSGDPSPDNVRPITGWTGVRVTRRGKNLIEKPAWTTRTQDGVTATLLEDGRVSVTGTGTNTGFAIIVYNSVDLPAGTYIFNGQNNADVNKKLTLQAYNLTDDTQIVNRDTATDYTFTLDKPSQVNIRIGLRVGVSVTDAILSPMIRHVSSADPTYEPYVSRTHTITFPSEAGTVYGGTLDVTTGTLTVTHKLYTFDGSENWVVGNQSSRYEFYSTIPDGTNFRTWVDGGRGLSNIGIYDGTAHNTESAKDYIASRTTLAPSATGNRQHVLIVPPSIATTAEELKAFLANTPEQWYAPLQTPQTYQLTPQEITSLLGTNNVWADTGDCEVEYRADAKMYIDKKITEAVSALS